MAAGFGFACERDDRGRGDDKHGSKCDDIVRKHAYVPLTIVPIPLSTDGDAKRDRRYRHLWTSSVKHDRHSD